ncbi:choice-of-anchor D domain-containing protein [Microscilla marina]|nr:choice-of-anchor D domain-containing protein [Microscilla marina]
MKIFRQRYFNAYRRAMGVLLLCVTYILPSYAFTPTDTLHWKKKVKKYAQKHASVPQLVNYLNSKKLLATPATLPLGSEYTFETDAVHNLRAARINDSVFVVVYDAVPLNDRYVIAGKLTPTGTITFGSQALVVTLASQPSQNLDIARLDDSKFMIAFDDGGESEPQYFAVVGSVSEENITLNATTNKVAIPTADHSSFFLEELRLTALSSTRCLITYTQNNVTQQGIAIVAGVSVSFPQSPVTFSSNTTTGISVDAFSNTKAVISYNDGGISIKNIIANIDGAGNISYGSPTTIYNSAGAGKTDVAVTNTSAYINIYENNGNEVRGIKNTASGDVITKGLNDFSIRSGASVNSLSIDKMSTDNAIIMVQDNQVYLFQVSANGSSPIVNYTNSFTANATGTEEAAFAVGMTSFKIVGVANTGVSGEGGAYIGDLTPPQVMKVFGNGLLIADEDNVPDPSDGTEFVDITVGQESAYQTFTIKNEGSGTLNLTGALAAIEFSNPGNGYTVSSPPDKTSLGPGETTTFEIEFSAASPGTYTNNIIIESNDPATGTNNWYNFAITGSANAVPPTIEIYGNSNLITSGATTAQTEDSTYFGGIPVGDSIEVHFDIENSGGVALLVGNITSSNSAFEIVQQIPTRKVNPGLSATFVVRFKPTVVATEATTISIPTNDPELSVFELLLEADGVNTLQTPVITAITSTQREVSLTWIDNNTTEFGYAIYRAEPSGPPNPPNPPVPGSFELVYLTDVDVTNFVDIGLNSNSTYLHI